MPGWKRTLYIMFFAQMVTAVGFSSIFPFLPLYVADLGSATGLDLKLLAGLVFSSQALTMMIASPIWGSLADRYGRKLMVLRAMFGGAGILLLMGFARSAEELVLLRAAQGFVTGTVSAANALVAAETPSGHKGFAMGLLQAGLGGGVALGPVLGGALADAYGYAAAFYVTAALLLVAGILVWVGIREGEKLAEKRRHGWAMWRGILATPGVAMTYAVRFFVLLGRQMITPIAPLFIALLLASNEGVNTFTGIVIGAAAAATTLSSGVLGRLGDRLGHRRVAIVSMVIAGVFYLPQAWVENIWQLLVMQALVGVAMGGVIPSISALLADYTEKGEEGAVYGLDNSINAAARAAAPLVGAGVALWFGLRSTFLATALIVLGAAMLAWWRLPRPGERKPYQPWSKTSNIDYK